MLQGWRIAAPQYSQNHADMLDGEGAFRFAGRWNSKGVRVVYLGSSRAQAAMELLVHLGRADVLNSFHIMSVSFDEALIEHIDLEGLSEDWQTPTMASVVQAVGDEWIAQGSSAILQVPSTAISGEYNFLLNPKHQDFNKLELGPITPFQFDPRVVK